MPLERISIANHEENTDTLLETFTENYFVSVVVTNTSPTPTPVTKVTIWAVPFGAVLESQYAYSAFNLVVPQATTFETFRFAVNPGDTLYVRSSTDYASFSCTGILQDDAVTPADLPQTFTNKVIRGVDNVIYVDRGATAERLVSAELGYIRYNTDFNTLEVKTDEGWKTLGWAN
jgi:hypothetical protein